MSDSAGSMKEDVDQVIDLIASRRATGNRTIVGIAGPPASGKSTLAEAVVQALNAEDNSSVPTAVLLPMDGFHLDNRILESRGLLPRKGAPETFNADGFCKTVLNLQTTDEEFFLPKFDRQMDLAIANAIAIHPETSVVVVEGNYLLLKSQPWASLHSVFAATVFVCPTLDALKDRLRQRWLTHGLDADAAEARATCNDLINAETVIENSVKADLHLSQNYTEFGLRYAF